MMSPALQAQITRGYVIHACAELAHEANRLYCLGIGDFSQERWKDAAEWQRESAIRGVETALDGATPEDQHRAWCVDKEANGWTYGPTKDPERKTHPCLVTYADLPESQRRKDALYGEIVRAMAKALEGAA